MIEINLLPPQFRTVERTPLPIFLGLIGGIVIVAGMLGFLAKLSSDGRKLDEKKQLLTGMRDAKAKEVEEIRKIEKELQESQGRIDTVLNIAESKTYWALKLDQLSRVLPNYAWIENLTYDGGAVKLSCKARGTSWARYTELRQKIRNDTNFMYHFDQIPFSPLAIVPPGPQFLEPAVLSFNLTLPVRQVEQPAAQKK